MADSIVEGKASLSSEDEVPTVLIEPTRGLASLQLGALWEYRELLYFLVWRDVKVRYKQSVLGILWILIQPIVTIIIFSALFGRLLGVPSGGVPYPIFLYSALLPFLTYRFFPLGIWAMQTLNLSNYDVLLMTTTHSAKYVRTSPDSLVVAYCFTPFRLAWNPESYSLYYKSKGVTKLMLKLIINII